MKANVYGRQIAKEALDKYYQSNQSEFVAVYGRRRVGKTFLIREYMEEEIVFQFSGMSNSTKDVQLQRFSQTLARYTNSEPLLFRSWLDAFYHLERYVEQLSIAGKKVVFIDELPWLDTPNAGFMQALESFWNNWASARKDILLIVCGSITSWMTDNLINNHGGLYGRLTGQILLQPFTLRECEEYMLARGLHLSRYEICEAYMIFGGIPYYLNVIDPKRSLAGSIDFALFNPNGPLYDEYNHLFPAMFRKADNYMKVVRALAQQLSGMTRTEIIDRTRMSSGEGLTRVLKNLELCGFIRCFSPIGTKEKYYQIIDFYVLFYHRFLRDKQKMDLNYWTNIQRTSTFYQWAGTHFEQLVMQHVEQIRKYLKIEGVQTHIYALRTNNPDGSAQIDAVLQRADNTVNLCEMKFTEGTYAIDKKEDMQLRNRMQALRNLLPKRMSMQLTLITTYGLQPNQYANQVNQTLTIDDLF
jgi:hypothetical protein